MQAIEKEAAGRRPAAAAARARAGRRRSTRTAMLRPPLLQRMIVGSWVLITINTLIFGFVIFLPQFFLRQGLTIANSLGYTRGAGGRLAGRLRGRRLHVRLHRAALEHHRRLGGHHRVRLDLCALQRGVRSRDRARASASC